MTTNRSSGRELHLEPAEELVPCIDWYDFLNKVTAECLEDAKVALAKGGYRHHDADFWRVLVFMCLNHLAPKAGANELNDLLHERKRDKRGRPTGWARLGGTYPRFERMAPNESQVNAYLRKLPRRVKERLPDLVFKAQVDLALELGLLAREVEVYVDYTNKWYYGKDVFPTNPYITGVHDGPGTNRARKFCALMLASGSTWLFAGVFLTQKGKSKAPAVADAVAKLLAWGFTVRRASGDREVSNYDVIARLAQLDIPYTGTMKKTPGVRPVVTLTWTASACRWWRTCSTRTSSRTTSSGPSPSTSS